ncbi:hypothetical protein [Herbaspirillum huttiense]|uniref:hypothetical protein n=1 Tax=Herbaspirillum huttiense TaxID=863372 RepID=UPI0031E0FD39
MSDIKDPDDDGTSDWDKALNALILEELLKRGITSIEDAPDDLYKEAKKEALKQLGPRPDDED